MLVVDPEGRPTYFEHDALGRQVARRNAFDHTWVTVYDARSSVVRQVDPEGRPAYMAYDGARRLTSQWNALGERSYFLHDARGSRTVVKNPRGFKTRLRYDLLGRQTHRIDALGGVSYMGHDEVGNRVLSVDELGHPTYFAFDGLDRLSTVTDALGGVTYMGYDARSSVVLRVDADGRATYMAYDDARRLERTWFANPVVGETADPPTYFSYDPAGNLLTSDDTAAGLGVSVNEYDAMNRLKTKVTLAGAVYYDYDLSGKKLRLIDADAGLSYYVYDEAGRLQQLVLDGTRTADYEYDPSGMLRTKRLPSSKVMSYYQYDVAGRLKLLRNVDETNTPLSYFSYDRNENGAAIWIRREGAIQQYYEYDARDRLTLDELRDGSTPIYGFRYHYDAASNRARKDDEVQDRAVYYTYDARNLLMQEVLSHTGAATYFDFDQALRLRVEHSTSEARYYSYDQRDQPTQIRHEAPSDPDVQHDFSYNGLGERVRVAEGSTEAYWSYDGSKLIRERRSDDTFATFRRYRHNKCPSDGMGSVIEIDRQSFVQQYPAFDHRGSTQEGVALIDGTVPAINYYQYDAFGVRLGQSSTSGSADAAQRMQFASPIFARLNTTPSIYVSKSGVYLAERGISLTGGLQGLLLGLGGGPWLRYVHGVGPGAQPGHDPVLNGDCNRDNDDPKDEPLEARTDLPVPTCDRVTGKAITQWPLPAAAPVQDLIQLFQLHAFTLAAANAWGQCILNPANCYFVPAPEPDSPNPSAPTVVCSLARVEHRRHEIRISGGNMVPVSFYQVFWFQCTAETIYPCKHGQAPTPVPVVPQDVFRKIVEAMEREHRRVRRQYRHTPVNPPLPPMPPTPLPPQPPPPSGGGLGEWLAAAAAALAMGLAYGMASRGGGGGGSGLDGGMLRPYEAVSVGPGGPTGAAPVQYAQSP